MPGNRHSTDAPRQSADELTDQDRAILRDLDRALADSLTLKRWWEQKNATGEYQERFSLIRDIHQPLSSFGFFDEALVGGRPLAVMGVVEEMIFDQPKQAPPERIRDEFREFLLRYFMRVSAFEKPTAYSDPGQPPPATYQPGLSWCPWDKAQKRGFGFSQLYYQRVGSGAPGKFSRRDEFAIVDLRDIGPQYDWIMCKVRIYDFKLRFRPSGPRGPTLELPLKEHNYLVLSRDFVTCRDDPEPGVLGEYGLGYGLLRDTGEDSVFAYGPGRFCAGFQLINFRILASGESRARLVFVVNRPHRILDVTLDPVDWGFRLANFFSFGLTSRLFAPAQFLLERLPLRVSGLDPVSAYVALANLLTGGLAGEQLCVSRQQLEKDFLVQHFLQHYGLIVGSLRTWRQVPDWLDEAALPERLRMGVSL
jgi:hypothetical protein